MGRFRPECNRGGSGSGGGFTERNNARLVAGRAQEAQEVFGFNPRRHGVLQRMKIERILPHQGGVEDDLDALFGVVDGGKGRHRARRDTEGFFHQGGLAERESPGGVELFVQALEVDFCLLAGDGQKQPVLAVDQEQIFGMGAGDFAAQMLRFLDAEERRVLDGDGFDAEFGEESEEIGGRRGHEARFLKEGVFEGFGRFMPYRSRALGNWGPRSSQGTVKERSHCPVAFVGAFA